MTKRFNIFEDEIFLKGIHWTENFVAKSLSLALVIVILVALVNLVAVLGSSSFALTSIREFHTVLITIFGLFLNILIALELLENITSYFRKQVIQVELVVVTALIAVARKVIVFNSDDKLDLIPLAVAALALSISYWLLRNSPRRRYGSPRLFRSAKGKSQLDKPKEPPRASVEPKGDPSSPDKSSPDKSEEN